MSTIFQNLVGINANQTHRVLDMMVDIITHDNVGFADKGTLTDPVMIQIDALATIGSFQVEYSESYLADAIKHHVLSN